MKTKDENQEQLPTVVEVIEKWLTPGTLLKYQAKKITFDKYPLSVVKSLKVNICSTETVDMGVLHKIQNNVRTTRE